MYKFTKVSNGHTLEITVPKTDLFAKIDNYINDVRKILQELEDLKQSRGGQELSEEELRDFCAGCDFGLDKVYGDAEVDYCTPEEVMSDLEKFKKCINELIEDNGKALFNLLPTKKNGTFNLKVKHIVKQAINGWFSYERYGWSATALRVVASDDTHAELVLDEIIVKYS